MTPINLKPKESGGKGGLWGKIMGGLAGLVGGTAAVVTGGASAAAIPAMMGAGSTAGGLIGGAVDPYKVKQPGGPTTLENYMSPDPESQIATLNETEKLIATSPDFDSPTAQQYIEHLSNARNAIRQRMKFTG